MLPVGELALDASFSGTGSAYERAQARSGPPRPPCGCAAVWLDTEEAPRRGAKSLEGVL